LMLFSAPNCLSGRVFLTENEYISFFYQDIKRIRVFNKLA